MHEAAPGTTAYRLVSMPTGLGSRGEWGPAVSGNSSAGTQSVHPTVLVRFQHLMAGIIGRAGTNWRSLRAAGPTDHHSPSDAQDDVLGTATAGDDTTRPTLSVAVSSPAVPHSVRTFSEMDPDVGDRSLRWRGHPEDRTTRRTWAGRGSVLDGA